MTQHGLNLKTRERVLTTSSSTRIGARLRRHGPVSNSLPGHRKITQAGRSPIRRKDQRLQPRQPGRRQSPAPLRPSGQRAAKTPYIVLKFEAVLTARHKGSSRPQQRVDPDFEIGGKLGMLAGIRTARAGPKRVSIVNRIQPLFFECSAAMASSLSALLVLLSSSAIAFTPPHVSSPALPASRLASCTTRGLHSRFPHAVRPRTAALNTVQMSAATLPKIIQGGMGVQV